MWKVVELVGLLSLVIAGFCVAVAVGFTVLGAGCLWAAGVAAREKRAAAAALQARRSGMRAA